MRKFVIAALLVHITAVGICQFAQLSLPRQALVNINKKNWSKAEQLLLKSLGKEPINPEANYTFSNLFLVQDYPKFNIDSSYLYYLQASKDFARSPLREKEKLKRFPLDSLILSQLKARIDSAAFARVYRLNTARDYIEFLEKFSNAIEKQKAIELRDEAAYVDALHINTYNGYNDYVTTYPTSVRARDAKERYEKLVFEEFTKEGKLSSYLSFLKNHPATPYKKEVEKSIFEITTASGSASAFSLFINGYPNNYFAKKALNILYYLSDEGKLLNDSLKVISALNKEFWIPILKDGKFGFMDNQGVEKISPQFETIDESYLCGNITTDFLITSTGVIGRSGKPILSTETETVEELGSGFLKVKTKNCSRLVHKSCFNIGDDCLEDAKIIASRFAATKIKGKWALHTLTGRLLIPSQFDDIYSEDELIIFVRSGKKVLTTTDEMAGLAQNSSLKETFVYDGVKSLGQGNYLVNNGSLQGVLSNKLAYLVPLDRQTILQTPYGFLQEKNNRLRLAGISKEIDNKDFLRVDFYNNWIRLQEKNNLILFDGKNKKIVESNLDSIWFQNKIAFALKGDSLTVHLGLSKSIALDASSEIKFMKSVDSIRYFYSTDKKKKTVIEIASGKKIFSIKASEIEHIGNGVFLIADENKKGLINPSGKPLLPMEYTAIVATGKKNVSLLKDKKFGLYDVKNGILIKPVYERNIIPYSNKKLVAFKDGFYGFVSWELKEESKFEFEEIQYWNDSIAFVKKDQWMLYDIYQKKIITSNIKDFSLINDTEKEKVALIHQDTYYGVISNTRGTILASSYNDILNLGTQENPLYFTEKFISEAEIHVVIYYNSKGKLLRKQAYETRDYERIYCENN